jgi:hypothetical protein
LLLLFFVRPLAAGLDGTAFRIDVRPDFAAAGEGATPFAALLRFVDGIASLDGRPGLAGSPYTLEAMPHDTEWTFSFVQEDVVSKERTVWKGKVRDLEIQGAMVLSRTDGTVWSYSFVGRRLG